MRQGAPIRSLPPLDPRTVSLAVLAESMPRRPAILHAVLSQAYCTLSNWDDRGELCKVAVTHDRLNDENDAALLTRVIPVCMARLLVVSAAPVERRELLGLTTPFRESPHLGATTGEGGYVAMRGDIWTAFGGFDAGSNSFDQACRSLFEKMYALGFGVPGGLALETHLKLGPRDAIYTAITDCYDTLKPQPRSFAAGARQVAFLDPQTADLHGKHRRGWEVTLRGMQITEPRRAARYWKTNAHLALPEARVSLWVDASIAIVAPMNLQRLAGLFLGDRDICVFHHHARNSIAEEAEACKRLGLDDAGLIDRQLAGYSAEGFPDRQLAELPVILRKHTPAVQALNEAWWSQIVAGSHRDQLSFNYVASKTGVRYDTFPMTLAVRNGLFVKFQRVDAEGKKGQ